MLNAQPRVEPSSLQQPCPNYLRKHPAPALPKGHTAWRHRCAPSQFKWRAPTGAHHTGVPLGAAQEALQAGVASLFSYLPAPPAP